MNKEAISIIYLVYTLIEKDLQNTQKGFIGERFESIILQRRQQIPGRDNKSRNIDVPLTMDKCNQADRDIVMREPS